MDSSADQRGRTAPLTPNEIADLYQTNTTVTPDEEAELGYPLPDPATLLAPADFEALVNERHRLLKSDRALASHLWKDASDKRTAQMVRELAEKLAAAAQYLDDNPDLAWRTAAVEAGYLEVGYRQPWEHMLRTIEDVNQKAGDSHARLADACPVLPSDWQQSDCQQSLDGIIAHLEAGHSVGWLTMLRNPAWKDLIHRSTVHARPPATREDFYALRDEMHLQKGRAELCTVWSRLMSAAGGPTVAQLGGKPEQVCRQWVDGIRTALNWGSRVWQPLCLEMAEQGFQWDALLATAPPRLPPHAELLRLRDAVLNILRPVFAAEESRRRVTEIDEHLRVLTQAISAAGADNAEVVAHLNSAIREMDAEAYRWAHTRLLGLYQTRSALSRRRELIAKLDVAAPSWASAIRNRQGIHAVSGPPGDGALAWRWRQLNDELDRRARTSIPELLRQLADAGSSLRRLTTQVVDKRTWAEQRARTDLPQQQALTGYALIQRQIGAGYGRQVPQLRAEARRLLPTCQAAVPVWIMPMARAVETFDPRVNKFDVVIIDEASQANLMALATLYLGAEIVVVGDDNQNTPAAVGLPLSDVQQLREAHLEGIPNPMLYNGNSSIYDMAQTSFGGSVFLREHFRCVRPIIEFSNQLAYEGRIKPLRDAGKVRTKPATVAYRVEGAITGHQVNDAEAVAIASLLIAATEQDEYDSATFGVISMVGNGQANRISRLLQRYMEPAEYVARKIQCGNSAQFQGDERDVMFLSVVDAPRGNGPLPLRRNGAGDMYKKMFNVAASRACDQMWVVHSVDPEVDLQPEDIRRRLILHARNPWAFTVAADAAATRAESEFERQVLDRLVRAGYRVIPQYEVGAYRIDIVVEDGTRQLAVECDGDRWHGEDRVVEDMERQGVLERLKWTFERIRGSQFFRNPAVAMEPVFARLEALGIRPVGPNDIVDRDPVGDELKQRVVTRAAELRREWFGDTGVPAQCPGTNGSSEDDEDPDNADDGIPSESQMQQDLFAAQ